MTGNGPYICLCHSMVFTKIMDRRKAAIRTLQRPRSNVAASSPGRICLEPLNHRLIPGRNIQIGSLAGPPCHIYTPLSTSRHHCPPALGVGPLVLPDFGTENNPLVSEQRFRDQGRRRKIKAEGSERQRRGGDTRPYRKAG